MPKFLSRSLRLLALAMMAVAAMFGIPLVIDPPPGDRVSETDPERRKKGRGRRHR